eukprot:Rhum_TRINITY_DN7995_c0_g1::Rhum_TRINITY_DN7995_c0_g1_i1::g.25561::m.25561
MIGSAPLAQRIAPCLVVLIFPTSTPVCQTNNVALLFQSIMLHAKSKEHNPLFPQPDLGSPRTRQRKQHAKTMHIVVSWDGGEQMVEVDEACRSVAALRSTLAAALPEVDTAKVRLEVGGRAVDDDDDDDAVCSLCDGCVVAVSATPAALAAATLRRRGHAADLAGFCCAAEDSDLSLCELYLDAEVAVVPASGGCPDTTPLHIACRQGNLALCALLVERNFPLEVEDADGDRPLHVAIDAAEEDSLEVCRLLIERCSIDAPDDTGRTPLHAAVSERFVEVCELLIDRDCHIDLQDGQGRTPLHLAVRADSVELCALLIDNHAALDVCDLDGNTPLHEAVLSERSGPGDLEDVGRLLLESGAACSVVNAAGYTPRDLVTGGSALHRLLAVRGAKRSTAFARSTASPVTRRTSCVAS